MHDSASLVATGTITVCSAFNCELSVWGWRIPCGRSGKRSIRRRRRALHYVSHQLVTRNAMNLHAQNWPTTVMLPRPLNDLCPLVSFWPRERTRSRQCRAIADSGHEPGCGRRQFGNPVCDGYPNLGKFDATKNAAVQIEKIGRGMRGAPLY